MTFFLYCITCQGVKGNTYIGQDLYNITVSGFITVISSVYWKHYGSDKFLKNISLIILVCAFVISLIVYSDFLQGVSLLQRTYAYQSKNSMGPILLASCIIALTAYTPQLKLLKAIYYIIICTIIVIVFMLKSRATLVGFFFVIAYYIIKYPNRNVRVALSVLTVFIVGYILFDVQAYNNIVNGILLGGRSGGSIDDISSGRTVLIKTALDTIPNNLFFGIGNKYMDCFPVVMVLQYGLIGSSVVFIFLIKCAQTVKDAVRKLPQMGLTIFLLFYVFLLNSLFEAQPPFGPGVKCFLLWMVFGFVLTEIKNSKNYAEI